MIDNCIIQDQKTQNKNSFGSFGEFPYLFSYPPLCKVSDVFDKWRSDSKKKKEYRTHPIRYIYIENERIMGDSERRISHRPRIAAPRA